MGNFHEGEIAVQKQAGTQSMARRIGNGIYPFIFDSAAEFLQDQTLAIIASHDATQQVWASLLTGRPGFLQAISATTLRIDAQPRSDDPLTHNLQPGTRLGLLAIDLTHRLRLRLNGTLSQQTSDALCIDTQEVYGNCQKYIQSRTLIDVKNAAQQSSPQAEAHHGVVLTPDQQSWVVRADTFFIASMNPNGDADASHRGGNPGFIHVLNDHALIFPDYSGNMMFNTLGNIALNPATGLLFLDFETGRTLQLTGRAAIIWDDDRIAAFPGAQRLVTFEIAQVIESQDGFGFGFGAPEYSRFNPS